MKKPVGNASKMLTAACALSASLAFSQLPATIGLETFYNVNQVNLRADSVKIVHIAEVPGLPKHLFVLDQKGKIWGIFPNATGYSGLQWYNYQGTDYVKHLLANFSGETAYSGEGEAGAYSIAFHPLYAQNRKFYVYYYRKDAAWAATKGNDDFGNPTGVTTLDEWQVDAADLTKVTRLRTGVFKYFHEPSIGGGTAKFGPDGYMYLTVSDYDGSGRDLRNYGRKVLRIDLTSTPASGASYAIPSDNPYVNDPDTAIKREIWAVGFRNPWTTAFNWDNGDLWLGDVDQSNYEEINLVVKKGNYGWDKGGDLGINGTHGNSYSGPCATAASPNIKPADCSPFTDPAFYFPRTGTLAASCIIVGDVFRGAQTSPFYGALISSDNTNDRIFAAKKGDAQAQVVGNVASLLGGGTDHRGIASMTSGVGGVIYVAALDWFDPANRRYGRTPTFYEVYRLASPDLTLKTFNEVTAVEKQRTAKLRPSVQPRLIVDLGFSRRKENPGKVYGLSGKLSSVARGAGVYFLKHEPHAP